MVDCRSFSLKGMVAINILLGERIYGTYSQFFKRIIARVASTALRKSDAD